MRFRTRLQRRRDKEIDPAFPWLHLGCGPVRVPGWLNVDVTGSDYDLDLGQTPLPWKSSVFEAVVGEHVIEHLDLKSEVLPLLGEIQRILVPGGELWLSTPDIEKICRSYLDHRMQDLLEDRQRRWSRYSLGEYPPSQMINDFFHQGGSHMNLFDFALMDWALSKCGFVRIQRTSEAVLLERFPEFPVRNDDLQTLYVLAYKP